MGGYGSGRYGYSTTAKLDGGLKIDLNKLIRDGIVLRRGWKGGAIHWSWVGTGERMSSIGYGANTLYLDDMWLRVHYNTTIQDEKHDMDYKIKLTTTQPHYGGKRLWFICPLTNNRTSVLYCPSGSKYFASRHAYNLKYKSQSKSPHDRATDKMWNLKHKLGGEDYYIKPKGMHKETHERLMHEIWDAEGIAEAYFSQFVVKLSKRLSKKAG